MRPASKVGRFCWLEMVDISLFKAQKELVSLNGGARNVLWGASDSIIAIGFTQGSGISVR